MRHERLRRLGGIDIPGEIATVARLAQGPLEGGDLEVRTLDRSIDFYARIFGPDVTERLGDAMAFLSSSELHYTLALRAPAPAPSSLGRS